MQKILIAGGTGFIGQALTSLLLSEGFEVVILSRYPKSSPHLNLTYFYWSVDEAVVDAKAFEGVDVIINLAGENIGAKRWSRAQKNLILSSRVDSSKLLFQAVAMMDKLPKLFISASAVGYYGNSNNETIMTEIAPVGTDFLAHVCSAWEAQANQFMQLDIPVALVRTGVVLQEGKGALKEILSSLKFGMLFKLGNGKQPFPWIHIDDLCRAYLHLIRSGSGGVYNAAAPANNDFNSVLNAVRLSKHTKPFILPVPSFVLKIVLGEMSTIVLKGAFVAPTKLINEGFVFKYPNLKVLFEHNAIKNLGSVKKIV